MLPVAKNSDGPVIIQFCWFHLNSTPWQQVGYFDFRVILLMPHVILKWHISQFLFLDKACRGIWTVSGGNITSQNMCKHSAWLRTCGGEGQQVGWCRPRVKCPGRFSVFPQHQIYKVSPAGLVMGAEEIMRAKHSGVCFFNEPTVSVNYYYC